jgi:hypothetical protein
MFYILGSILWSLLQFSQDIIYMTVLNQFNDLKHYIEFIITSELLVFTTFPVLIFYEA